MTRQAPRRPDQIFGHLMYVLSHFDLIRRNSIAGMSILHDLPGVRPCVYNCVAHRSPTFPPDLMAMRIVTDSYAKPTPPVQVRVLRALQYRARRLERLRGIAHGRNLSA